MKLNNIKYIALFLTIASCAFITGCDEEEEIKDTRESMDNVAEKVVDATKTGLKAAGEGVETAAEATGEVIVKAADTVKEVVTGEE